MPVGVDSPNATVPPAMDGTRTVKREADWASDPRVPINATDNFDADSSDRRDDDAEKRERERLL
jgi:hypothetical protein